MQFQQTQRRKLRHWKPMMKPNRQITYVRVLFEKLKKKVV